MPDREQLESLRQRVWGSVPVPWTVAWTAEDRFYLGRDPSVPGKVAVCNDVAPGVGKPMFGKPHMQRQRKCIAEERCDLCAKPLKGRTKVSLSHARPRAIGAVGSAILQVEPLLHKECAAISMRHCPSLKRDIRDEALMVRLVQRFRVQFALLDAVATEEFCGQAHSGAVGHAKVELLAWRDMPASWLAPALLSQEQP